MTKKTNNKRSANANARVKELENKLLKVALEKKQKPKRKQDTPFSNAGEIMGKSIGGMFGNSSIGRGVGKWLGSGIGSIFGSGDYTTIGPSPKYNVITNGSQIPQFDSTRQRNIVCHREYLGDIQGTAGFNNVVYPLNPGMPQTFPWLSSVAGNYQEYRFHGVVFEFKTLLTDFIASGAPGVVVMSTNYNAAETAYVTKQQMENAEYAVSVKPTLDMMHGIECALGQTIVPEKYVRSGAVPAGQDLRLYDLGIFQFATQSNPVQDLGELWVSYCVEFFKPAMPSSVGGNVMSGHLFRTGVTSALPIGNATVTNTGQLALNPSGTTISFLAQPQQQYIAGFTWAGSAAFINANPGITFTGCLFKTYWTGDISNFIDSPNAGTSSTCQTMNFTFVCNLLNPGVVSINVGGTGVWAATTTLDAWVMELDSTITA